MPGQLWQSIVKLSLTTKLIAILIVLITVPLVLISFFSYSNYSRSVQNLTVVYVNQISKNILERVDQYVSDIKRVTGSQIYMQDIQVSLANPVKSLEDTRKLQDFIKGLNSLKNDTEAVYIFDKFGNFYHSTKRDTIRDNIVQQVEQLQEEVKKANGSSIVISTQKFGTGKANDYYFSVARELKNTNTLESIGIVIFDSNIRVIADAVNELDQATHGQTIVVDDRNTVIYDSEQRWISTDLSNNPIVRMAAGDNGSFQYTLDGRRYLSTYATSAVTGWKQIVLIPIDQLTQGARKTRNFTLLLVVVLIAGALFISIWLTLTLTRPMRDLMRSMKQVNKDNLNVQIPIKYSDEFGILAKHFNSMIRRIQNLVDEVYVTQNRKRKAELRSLQHQINPHFIYNTLEVIRMTAEVKRDYEISDMTYNLGELLRYGIIRGSETVTFAKEMEHLEQYVTLQNYRFSKDIQLDISVREPHSSYRLIKLLFQPIVENAIVHGFETKEDDCRIAISSYEDGQFVYFAVADNGSGIEEEKLKEIRQSLKGEPTNRTSIGIENVNERIQLRYGAIYGLRVESTFGAGTTVTLALPINQPAEGD